jgi:hypothetical protein
MRHFMMVLLVAACACAVGQAQSSQGIQWDTDPQRAVAAAQKTKLPLLIYVLAGSKDRDDKTEQMQRKALDDPRVRRLSQRFICARVSRSAHRDFLQQLHLSPSANMEIFFVAPDGTTLGDLGPGGVGNADSLCQKMSQVFTYYRQRLFDTELRPILEDKDAKPAELRPALERVRDLIITGADVTVATLLDREGLDAKTAALCYQVLAQLSTKAGVAKLLERSVGGDSDATKALSECTPAAAQIMMAQIKTGDGGVRLDIYRAVGRICRIENLKPDKWWEKSKETLQEKELERIGKLVEDDAERWKKENELYR